MTGAFIVQCPACRHPNRVRGELLQRLWSAIYTRADGRAWEQGRFRPANRDGTESNRPCQPLPGAEVRCGACAKDIIVALAVVASTDVHLPFPRAVDDPPMLNARWNGPIQRIAVLGQPWAGATDAQVLEALDEVVGHLPAGQARVFTWPEIHRWSAAGKWVDARGFTYEHARLGEGAGPLNTAFIAEWKPDLVIALGREPLEAPVRKSTDAQARQWHSIKGVLALAERAGVRVEAVQGPVVRHFALVPRDPIANPTGGPIPADA